MKIRPYDVTQAKRLYEEQSRPGGTGFAEMLKKIISETNELTGASQSLSQAAVAGAPVEAHDVMIAVEEARLAFDLMLEVRNKLIEAYRELMQMRM